jgi:hypothetical protein
VINSIEPQELYGYVSFYSSTVSNEYEDELPLEIIWFKDGEEQVFKNSDWWSTIGDFRIACPVGKQEFSVSHKNFNHRFKITIQPDRVTFISLRKQYESIITNTIGYSTMGENTVTTSSYYVRHSSGNHSISSEEWGEADVMEALNSPDWGIRHYGLKLIEKSDPLMTTEEISQKVKVLYQEDSISYVRLLAEKALQNAAIPLPASPIFFESFEDNHGEYWPIVRREDLGVVTSFSDEGYDFKVDTKSERWVLNDIWCFDKDKSHYEISLDCIWEDGNDSLLYGLCLGAEDQDFFVFGISGNGGAALWRYNEGNWNAPIPWTQDAAESITTSKSSRIGVNIIDQTFHFTVNSIEIGSIESDQLLKKIGLLVRGPQEVKFQKLMIY